MSNIEYVKELCGTDQVGWVCEQLAKDLDARDKRIEKLEATIEQARGLQKRWREGDFDLPPYLKGKMDGCHQCADELEAILRGENNDV